MNIGRSNRSVCRWCSRLLPLFLVSSSAQAQRFVEITAQIELLAYRGDDTNGAARAQPKTISVVCVAGTNEWGEENDYVQGGRHKWFFDGTNVYQSIRVTMPMPQEMRDRIAQATHFAQAPFEVARSNLTINVWPSRDGNPLGDAGVNIPWLAFCSGHYLRREGRLVPLPLEPGRHTRDRFAYTDQTETFQDDFGLPRKVDLFLSRSLFMVSEIDFDKEAFRGDRSAEWIKKRAQNLEEGAHMFHFAVTESTNFLGWTFPTRFEFFQNARKFEPNGDWYWQGTGSVKSIRASAKPEGLFDTRMQQSIVDWRFRDPASSVNALTYTSTNAFLSPTNDPVLVEKLAKHVARVKPFAKKGAPTARGPAEDAARR